MEIHGSDRLSTAMLVLRAIDDIDHASEEKRNVLLMELVWTAWGDPAARNQ
jgi:hypothetical protein